MINSSIIMYSIHVKYSQVELLSFSGRQLNENELIGYPFTTLNGYGEITGCRDCFSSPPQSGIFFREISSPNCTEDCPQMVATPYPMKLFDDKDNYTYIRVSLTVNDNYTMS